MAPVAWSARVCPACGARGPVASQAGGGRVVPALVLCVAAVLGYGLWERSASHTGSPAAARTARGTDVMRKSALAALRADNPRASHIAWSGSGSLWVWMHDDGTPRDGLARYYCEALAQHRIYGVTVRIIDSASVRAGPRTIGRAHCRAP